MLHLPQVFSSCERIINSQYQGVHTQLAALQAEQLRAAEALALVCRRMHAYLRRRPLTLQLSFRVPLRAATLDALLSPELSGTVEALHPVGLGLVPEPAQARMAA